MLIHFVPDRVIRSEATLKRYELSDGNGLGYGTDWMFLPLTAKTRARFPAGLSAFVSGLGAADKDVFWVSAARFRGLTTGGAETVRLREFYKGDATRRATLEILIAPEAASGAGQVLCPV